MTTEMTCYECRFFSPGENGCPSYQHNEELGEFEEAKEGLCRRQTPRHGKTLKRPNDDEFVCFAEWPKVMHCDWCGEFKPRLSHVHDNKKTCIRAEHSEGESYCEK